MDPVQEIGCRKSIAASDLGPAWLGDEPVANAVATAARDANQELKHPSQ
jgi:hypothetical protein